jgi:hypothetical protein
MRNANEQVILQVIYQWFREHDGQWPDFDTIRRWLDRYRQIDATRGITEIPRELLRPLCYIDGRPDPGGKLILTAEGVAKCVASDDDIRNLERAVRWMTEKNKNYDPPQDRPGSGVPITPWQLAHELHLPLNSEPKSIRRLIALLRAEDLVSSDEYP